MTRLTFDTLKCANRLKEAGVKEKEAEAIIQVLQEAQQGADLATKNDFLLVKRDLFYVTNALELRISEMKAELIKWVVSVAVLQTAIIAALVMKLTG